MITLAKALRHSCDLVGVGPIVSRLAPPDSDELPTENPVAAANTALAESDRDEREAAINELFFDHPYAPETVAAALDSGWLADRPVEAGLFAWDALNLIYFPPQFDALVARLKGLVGGAADILPARGLLIGKSSKELGQWVWAGLKARLDGLESTSETVTLKRQVVETEHVAQEQIQPLVDAVLYQADMEAAQLLAVHCDWDQPAEYGFALAETVLDRALPLVTAGYTTYGSYLLKMLLQFRQDEEAWAQLIDLYIRRGDLSAATDALEQMLAVSELDEDYRIGISARVALFADKPGQARALLSAVLSDDIDDPDEIAEDFPWTTIAAAEFLMTAGGSAPILACVHALVLDDPVNRHAHRLLAYMNFCEKLHGEDFEPDHALHELTGVLREFPGDSSLWRLYRNVVKLNDITTTAQQWIMAAVLVTHPCSTHVWQQVLPLLEDPIKSALEHALTTRLKGQLER